MLPRTITTRIELEDVDVGQIIAKAQFLLGSRFPLPIQGRLGLNAEAMIPLGKLRDFKDYAFHGDLTLKGASLAGVDVGHASARIDLADGVVVLKDLRGRLVNNPGGNPGAPPAPTALDVPPTGGGELPSGAFRGEIRAELSPPGALTARFEGNALPLGELAAPLLPRPTPLAGLASLSIDGRADLAHASDPKVWDVTGHVQSEQIRYHDAVLDRVAFPFQLKGGNLVVADLSAALQGEPLSAHGSIDLAPPRRFDAVLDVTAWNLRSLSTFIPALSISGTGALAGTLDARAQARGTLSPLSVQTEGSGRLGEFQAGPVPLGDVPFRFATEQDTVVFRGIEAQPFGGRLDAVARVPLVPERPIEATARFQSIDTALLTNVLPDRPLRLTGKADGEATLAVPGAGQPVSGSLRLSAPNLTIQGLPADQLQADLRAHQGLVHYDLNANSLGGTVKLQGDLPIVFRDRKQDPEQPLASDPAPGPGNGRFHAIGFNLHDLWPALGLVGPVAHLSGLGAFDANLRVEPGGPDAGLWAHGIAEFRDLSWRPGLDLAHALDLGQLRGIVTRTPADWRIVPISGEVLGGVAQGQVWGKNAGPRSIGYELRMEQLALKRAAVFLPAWMAPVDGVGTLHLSGTVGEASRSTADLEVPLGQIAGLAVRELRIPAELVVSAGEAGGNGLLALRRVHGRLAGGQVQGDAQFRIGLDHSFQGDFQLAGLDLEAITRVQSDAAHPASGRVSGKLSLNGAHPADPSKYRGKINLELTDASLFSVPVFREIDRFLAPPGADCSSAGGWSRPWPIARSSSRLSRLKDAWAASRHGHHRVRHPTRSRHPGQHQPDHPPDWSGARPPDSGPERPDQPAPARRGSRLAGRQLPLHPPAQAPGRRHAAQPFGQRRPRRDRR